MNKPLSQKINVIAVVGPTASGKTSYSIKLAKEIDGEIISADSRLVYKGFDIGTAKPSVEERAGIPHFMIDIVEPEYDYSAGLYKDEACRCIDDINKRGKIPIIVGGTGLYIDILLKNYNLPRISPNRELRNELYKKDNNALFKILRELDRQASDSIDINDKKKIIRAIEIIKTTGMPLDFSRGVDKSHYNVKWIGRNYDRNTLYERINMRVDQMLDDGLVDETKYLLKKHGRISNLVCTIGYKEMIEYIDGKCSLDDAIALLKQNTRRYAKRQLTWFRRNPEIEWNIYPETLKK